MNEQDKHSFTAAGAMPWKLLQIKEQCITPDRRIMPVHIQLIPTNKCNGTCPWCSCSEVDRSLELSIEEIRELAEFFAARGTKAVTITGGGEPTLHPDFLEIIAEFKKYGISIGLVSNGIKWGKSPKIEGAEFLSGTLEWLRVSTMDTTTNGAQPEWLDNIAKQLRTHFGVSFTCGDGVSVELAMRIAKVAQDRPNATHIRFVQDILDPNDERLREIEAATKPITDKGIYQYRSSYTAGAPKCFISLLKPMINADGHIYPCCVEENEHVQIERGGKLMNIPIKDVAVGDACTSDKGTGTIMTVHDKSEEELLRVTLKTGRSVLVSEDHTMLRAAVKLKSMKSMRFEDYEVQGYDLEEIKASDLSEGDLLPIQMKMKQYESSDIGADGAFFAGAYVSEGWSSGGIGLMFGKDAHKLMREFTDVSRRLGITFRLYERRTGMQIAVHLRTMSESLRRLISSCGSRASEKRIPHEIQNASKDAKMAFFRGYFLGDGCNHVSTNSYRGHRVSMSTVSRSLASDMVVLLQQLGIAPTVSFEQRAGRLHRIESREVTVRDRYTIKIAGKYNLDVLEPVIGSIPPQTRSQRRAMSFPHKDNMMFVPIKSIELISGPFKVRDLRVASTSKFFVGVGGILVHNCGVQYANDELGLRTMPRAYDMGSWCDYDKLSAFNGGVCKKCYYEQYNTTLAGLLQRLKSGYHV